MDIPVFAVADRATVAPDGKLDLVGIFTHIHAFQFPAIHRTLTLALCLSGEPHEFHAKHSVELSLVGEDESEVLMKMKADGEVKVGSTTSSLVWIPMLFRLDGLKFPHPGQYAFLAHVNGDLLGRSDIELALLPRPSLS